jgi:hypothetical protein
MFAVLLASQVGGAPGTCTRRTKTRNGHARKPNRCRLRHRKLEASRRLERCTWLKCSSASLEDSSVERVERDMDESPLLAAAQHWVTQFVSTLTELLESPTASATGNVLESLLAADASWSGDIVEKAVGSRIIRQKLERALGFWELIGWYVPPNGIRYTLPSAEAETTSLSATICIEMDYVASGLWPLPWRPRVLCTGTLSIELECVDAGTRLQARTVKDTCQQSNIGLLRQLIPGLADVVSVFVAPLPENDVILERPVNARAQQVHARTLLSSFVPSKDTLDAEKPQHKVEQASASSNGNATGSEQATLETKLSIRQLWPPRSFREFPYRPYFECYLLPGELLPSAIRAAPDGVFPSLPSYAFNFSRFRRRLTLDPQQFSFVTPIQVRRWLFSELHPDVMTLLDPKDTAPMPMSDHWLPEKRNVRDPELLYDLLESQIASWSTLSTNEESILQWRFPVPIRFARGNHIHVAPHPYADAFGRGEHTPLAATVSDSSTKRPEMPTRDVALIYRVRRALSDAVLQRLEGADTPPLPSQDAHGRVLVRYAVSEDHGSIFYARESRGMLTPERLLRIRYDLLTDLRSAGRVPVGWVPHEARWRLSCYDCSVAFDEDGEVSLAVYRSRRTQLCVFRIALEVPRNLPTDL